MGLRKYKLGELIELSGEVNSDGIYGIDAVRGINNLKEMMKSKADLNGRDLTSGKTIDAKKKTLSYLLQCLKESGHIHSERLKWKALKNN